jgi:hypothetical protein
MRRFLSVAYIAITLLGEEPCRLFSKNRDRLLEGYITRAFLNGCYVSTGLRDFCWMSISLWTTERIVGQPRELQEKRKSYR